MRVGQPRFDDLESCAQPCVSRWQGRIRRRMAQGQTLQGAHAARVRYLSIVEATRLINASDPEFRPLVQAALQTSYQVRRALPS